MTTNPTTHDLAIIAEMTATNCVCCHRELTDSESVERGVGPVCSRKFYEVQHVVTEDHLLTAKGLLVQATSEGAIPGRVVDGFIKFATAGNVRKASNVLVYYASTVHDDAIKVLAVTPAIRALGYMSLADKLESDRTGIQALAVPNGEWAILFPQKPAHKAKQIGDKLRWYCKARKGRGPEGYGNRVAFYIKDDMFDAVLVTLGYTFGERGIWVEDHKDLKVRLVNPSRTYQELAEALWPERVKAQQEKAAAEAKRRAARLAANEAAKAREAQAEAEAEAQAAQAPTQPSSMEHRIITGKILRVFTPYNRHFVTDLKTSVSQWKERRWNPADGCWEVAPRHQVLVENLISKHYGVHPSVMARAKA